MKTDLHMHSVYSDGLFSPDALCAAARKSGVTHLALTDHDTCRGISQMRRAAGDCGLAFLPGAEISTGNGGQTHMLVYGCVEDERVAALLDETRGDRIRRAEKMLQLLEGQGIVLAQPVRDHLLSDENVGRAHIARALVEAHAVNTMKQAFDRYLDKKACCYVPRELKLAHEMLHALQGLPVVPVLAHPMETGLGETGVLSLIESLIPCGLRGVEAFHPSATAAQGRMLERFARQHGLLVTGGSDYHGDTASRNRLGHTGHVWNGMQTDTEALFNAALQY